MKINKQQLQKNQVLFDKNVLEMWNTKHDGIKHSIAVDFDALRRDGIRQWKIKLLRKLLPIKSVNYYVTDVDGVLSLFIEESQGKRDWFQNFSAFTVKVKIGPSYRRYHAGFWVTAISVFNDLERQGLLKNKVVRVTGYSHGAGAAPPVGSLIRYEAESILLENRVEGFEQPNYIQRPCTEVQEECVRDIHYVQGNDVVTKVPWWMKKCGIKIQIPARKLPWYKKPFQTILDHSIYESDPRYVK